MTNKSKAIISFRIILILLAIFACAVAIKFTFVPIYESDTLANGHPAESSPIYAGENISFTFEPIYSYIDTIELAVNFDTENPRAKDTEVFIYIEDTFNAKDLAKQKLTLYAIPSESFFPLYVGKRIPFRRESSVLVSLTNSSTNPDTSLPFTVLTDNDGNIFYRVTYITGYAVYRTLSMLFVILFLTAILFVKTESIISSVQRKRLPKNV